MFGSRFSHSAAFALGLLVMACQPSSAAPGAPAKDRLTQVLERKRLRAGFFVQPPAVMRDPNTRELKGSFVEAIKYVGKSLDVEVEFVEVDLADFAAGLAADRFDVSIGPTFRTIQRAKAVAFTETIFYLGYTGVVSKGRTGEFPSTSSIDRANVKVFVKEGSAIQQYVQDSFKSATIRSLTGTDLTLPLQAVSAGQADVGLMNEHTVEFYARAHPEVEIVLKDQPVQVVGMSWAVRPDDLRWLQFLNTSIEFLISTGKMAEWERKNYFGQALRRTVPESSHASIE